MNLQEILERFAIIAGLSLEETAPWTLLCEDACGEIRRNLKTGINEPDNARRLNVAAAALAFYRYVLYRVSSGGMESFTAGELRIKTDAKSAVKMAYGVWKDAKKSISDLISDNDFMFERID